jgi:hypothetical protein
MRLGALLKLLARGPTIWFAAFALLPAVMALVLVLAGEARSAGLVLGFSVYMCAMSGGYLGGQFVLAIGCSFVWTLPRFRRKVLREFVACGIAVSTVPALIVTVTAGASVSSLLAGVTGFAAFSLGGALSVIPEAQLVFALGWLAFMWFPTAFPSSVLDAPLIISPIALAISIVALRLGFGRRTFRWAVLNAREGAVGPISYQLHTLLGLRKRRPRRAGACPEGASRAPYVGTAVVRGVAYSYRAFRGWWLFANPVAAVILFALMTAGFVRLNLITEGPAASPNLWFGLVLVGALFSFFGRRSCSRVALPWSRRQHLAVAYTLDLLDTLGFLLATCPLAVAVFIAIAHPDAPLVGALARAGAATAVFLPVFQWPGRPPTGEPWLGEFQNLSALLVVRPVVILAGVALCVYGLPVIFTTLAAQATVLGLLLVASQALYWLTLRHAFTTRDLIGQSR